MKKKLLWIVPAVLVLLLLVGLGIYLDQVAGQKPLPEVTVPSTRDTTVPPTEESDPLPTESVSGSAATESTEPPVPTETEPPDTTVTEPVIPSTDPTEPPETDPLPTQTTAPTESTGNTDLAAKEERIDALVAEVYALRDYYTAQLRSLEASAISQYEALLPEERTPERKQEIALACIDAAYALEDACDARMDAICQELSYLLLETGGSMSLVTDIRYAYASEKEAARSEFLEKYADYFG